MSLKNWLLEIPSEAHAKAPSVAGDYEAAFIKKENVHKTHPWWQVMCLTGVDYFSTLGYQPGIAALAALSMAPVATLVLVLLTLFGAVPIYSRVASESPNGEGSVAMLEKLLRGWKGKGFVLVLLGFAATDFVITITLSAADATAHILENPFAPAWTHDHRVGITLCLIGLLGAVFLKGFKEAIGIAVVLVVVYLGLNMVTIVVALKHLFGHPELFPTWKAHLPLDAMAVVKRDLPRALGGGLEGVGAVVMASLLIFPKLALGLSGFETGVAVMPLVASGEGDPEAVLKQRIANTRKLLLWAAVVMSFYLLSSSLATTILIPHKEFERGGEANGRALAYLAHEYLGDGFGTFYDVSTILILWFAGASAMAALLNLVPRYLPRYGMAPEWARASRPLALVFMLVAFVVTIAFKADVDKQGGAYATGVLVLITSASVAATLSAKDKGQKGLSVLFGLIALIFVYTTLQNIHERPEGLFIASFFILAILLVSFFSRVYRTTELRVDRFHLDATARQIVDAAAASPSGFHFIANEPDARDAEEYRLKEKEQREDNHIPKEDDVIFLEVTVRDASDFSREIAVEGEMRFGYRVLKLHAHTIPNAIAAFLLYIRDTTGELPHAYFSWTEGNPLVYVFKYVALGEGDIAPVTREVLREAEPDPEKRPAIHVGG